MSTQLVFITLFLGLISGPRQVSLQAGPDIKSIRILFDGRQMAELKKAPWSAVVDFGPQVTPGELIAAGYDDHGQEVARVSQLVNLPRPTADFVIVLQNDSKGAPAAATLRWEHLVGSKPVKASLTVDGKALSLDSAVHAAMPPLNMDQPHVITAAIWFEDGIVARHELVVGGMNGDTAETQLTPIAVRPSSSDTSPSSSCFTYDGAPVRVAAIEKSPGLVIFVIDPDPRKPQRTYDLNAGLGPVSNGILARTIVLDSGTWTRILWPVAEEFRMTSSSSSSLFPMTNDIDGTRPLAWLLTHAAGKHDSDSAPLQTADAVGAAGITAMTGAHRRAVVLILSRRREISVHNGASTRKYLASIGVPLFVWSLEGPRPDLRDVWGDVEDVSSLSKLKIAVDRLREELASQRVAWVAANPLTALRIQPTGRCGITPLASGLH